MDNTRLEALRLAVEYYKGRTSVPVESMLKSADDFHAFLVKENCVDNSKKTVNNNAKRQ